MDLDLAAAHHRDFRRPGHIAAIGHLLGKPAIDALRGRLSPADLLGHGIEHREVLGIFRHQLAAKLERILSGRVRELIHEALEIDRVLIVVDAAPEARRDVRVSHGMIDQQIGNVVTERAFGAAGIEPLEGRGVATVLQPRRSEGGQDRLAGNPHVQAGEIAVGIERTGELALRDRMVRVLRHILFARPEKLDRGARHLLCDQHRLGDVIGPSAPAETAAEQELVHVALRDRQPRRLGGRGQRRFRILRARPHLTFVGRVDRGCVHRLHARMRLVRIAVDCLDLLRRAGDRCFHVALLIADESFLRIESGLEQLADRGAADLGVLALVPHDR